MLEFHKNNTIIKKNQGFTLIEILIVIAIIATLITTISLSVNLVKPDKITVFVEQLKNKINQSKNFSQNFNKATKFVIGKKNKNIVFYWLNSNNNTWKTNPKIPALSYKNFDILSDKMLINILPNGFIDTTEIVISNGKKTKSFALESSK